MTTVDIFGRRYNIRGESEPETIRALAGLVDRKMQQVAEQVGSGDALRVAVLAALNIADDYYQARRALQRREESVAERTRDLADRLGRAVESVVNLSASVTKPNAEQLDRGKSTDGDSPPGTARRDG